MADDYFPDLLPEDTTEKTVIRIGYCTAPMSLHIKSGFVVRKDDGRFYKRPGPFPRPMPPEGLKVVHEIDPFSPDALKARGYEIEYGKTPDHTKVNVGLKTWMRLSLAIGVGLITATSTPNNLHINN